MASVLVKFTMVRFSKQNNNCLDPVIYVDKLISNIKYKPGLKILRYQDGYVLYPPFWKQLDALLDPNHMIR